MASIEFIQKRIAGKEKELEKLSKKLERVRKAEAGNWETDNPYYYREYDLKSTLKDIQAAQTALDKYRDELSVETEKANSRDVKVILDFLEMWKAKVREHYGKGLEDYYIEKDTAKKATLLAQSFPYGSPEYTEADQKATELRKAFLINCQGEYETKEFINRWGKKDHTKVKIQDGKYEYLNHYNGESSLEAAIEKLNKDLEQEANRKYDFIIERTNAIVGTITDASNLTIGAKNDLNGFIIGTKGMAKVQTIGAGGYNIQCFHFRTLIDELK